MVHAQYYMVVRRSCLTAAGRSAACVRDCFAPGQVRQTLTVTHTRYQGVSPEP